MLTKLLLSGLLLGLWLVAGYILRRNPDEVRSRHMLLYFSALAMAVIQVMTTAPFVLGLLIDTKHIFGEWYSVMADALRFGASVLVLLYLRMLRRGH